MYLPQGEEKKVSKTMIPQKVRSVKCNLRPLTLELGLSRQPVTLQGQHLIIFIINNIWIKASLIDT